MQINSYTEKSMGADAFYFLRHARTQANLDGLMCGGEWDLPLCAEGVEQATLLGSRFQTLTAPTVIYSSPMERARQTTELVASAFSVPVHFLDELREWDLGKWDRLPFEKVKAAFLGNDDPEDGESRVAFRDRVALMKSSSGLQKQEVVS